MGLATHPPTKDVEIRTNSSSHGSWSSGKAEGCTSWESAQSIYTWTQRRSSQRRDRTQAELLGSRAELGRSIGTGARERERGRGLSEQPTWQEQRYSDGEREESVLRLSSSGLPTPRCDVREGKEATSDDPHPIPASEAHALLDNVPGRAVLTSSLNRSRTARSAEVARGGCSGCWDAISLVREERLRVRKRDEAQRRESTDIAVRHGGLHRGGIQGPSQPVWQVALRHSSSVVKETVADLVAGLGALGNNRPEGAQGGPPLNAKRRQRQQQQHTALTAGTSRPTLVAQCTPRFRPISDLRCVCVRLAEAAVVSFSAICTFSLASMRTSDDPSIRTDAEKHDSLGHAQHTPRFTSDPRRHLSAWARTDRVRRRPSGAASPAEARHGRCDHNRYRSIAACSSPRRLLKALARVSAHSGRWRTSIECRHHASAR
ncbi:hypothetical protein L1887_56610 [Cichorium endivia]|nr:hypothetical protein L1887_56610 [Cichorium endivia]